jgi:hypothetical protein
LKSAQKAATAFKDFNLSKFAKDSVPANYVDHRRVHDPKAVQDVQRASISGQLRKLSDADARNAGVTITFPTSKLDEMKRALPGMSESGGEITLEALLAYLGARLNGTSFYSRGNPVIKRLTAAVQARSQARTIIERVKNGTRQRGTGTSQNNAMRTDPLKETSFKVTPPAPQGGSKR